MNLDPGNVLALRGRKRDPDCLNTKELGIGSLDYDALPVDIVYLVGPYSNSSLIRLLGAVFELVRTVARDKSYT